MILQSLTLQNFRSYKKIQFDFSPQVTIIIGPNTAGKSNLLESLFLLSSGKSFRADKDVQMIHFGSNLARVTGVVEDSGGKETLEVLVSSLASTDTSRSFSKKFVRNGVPKRRVDFAGILPSLLFVPSDLDIITSSPTHRRGFLDSVLDLVDRDYRMSTTAYTRALRQRNALLEIARETGIRNDQQFSYWDDLLIKNGNYISEKREEFLDYCNEQSKDLLQFFVVYDKSIISRDRLDQYRSAEAGSGVTLVGPHRDDVFVEQERGRDVRHFGSRGQQRLVVLQLKLLQLSFIEQKLKQRPLLLLDDIFSELDNEHIADVLDIVGKQQTILTTTHQEFVPQELRESAMVIELKDYHMKEKE